MSPGESDAIADQVLKGGSSDRFSPGDWAWTLRLCFFSLVMGGLLFEVLREVYAGGQHGPAWLHHYQRLVVLVAVAPPLASLALTKALRVWFRREAQAL